jgi:hypothetical protein
MPKSVTLPKTGFLLRDAYTKPTLSMLFHTAAHPDLLNVIAWGGECAPITYV